MPYRIVHHPKAQLRRSLGKLAYWWIHKFVHYGNGDVYGQPVTFGPERLQELMWMYAVDENGKQLHDHIFLSKPKGADKSGFAAYLVCFEAVGPARFAGWAKGGEHYDFLGERYVYAPGEPMGQPIWQPRIRCLATEETQTGNIFDTVKDNFENGPLANLDPAPFDSYVEIPSNGALILPSTSGASSKDGGLESYFVADEALALDTPIPTPRGWTTMGDLQVGDEVLGSDGKPARVVKATEVQLGRKCYRVVTKDGSSVVASDGHLWAYKRLVRGPMIVGTTGALAQAVQEGAAWLPSTPSSSGSSEWGRRVVKVEEVPSVPVRCIAVDAEDHLFVAGCGMLVTHNTHLWTTPSLKKAYRTITRNLAKRASVEPKVLETTTMYAPGEGSIAEDTYEKARLAEAGKTKRDTRLLFIHRWGDIQVEDIGDEVKLRAALIDAEGDAAEWLDQDRIIDEIYDPANDIADSIRYYLNALSGTGASWLTPTQISMVTTQDTLAPGDEVALGFDGSLTGDSTALVAVRLRDNLVQLLHIQEAPRDGTNRIWSVDKGLVDRAVAQAFETFQVKAFFADPPYWQDAIEAWENEWGATLAPASLKHPIQWWTNKERPMIEATEAAHTLVVTGGLKISEHPDLIAHLHNARVGHHRTGDLIYKETKMSAKKIDAAVTMILALRAASAARGYAPKEKKTKDVNHGLFTSTPPELLVPKITR